MYMIEIAALENGAHRNQSYTGYLPEGWAVMHENPDELESFPFGEVEAEEIIEVPYGEAGEEEVKGIMTMTKWTPGEAPEVKPFPDTTLEDQVAELTMLVNILAGGEQA